MPLSAPVVIQVENSPESRPQSGLGVADVVYEYETEGGISRFSAFYFQAPASEVGPVRSARMATVRVTQAYGGTLLYSGSSSYVARQLNAFNVRHYGEEPGGALYRIGSRRAPHNLYTDGSHVAGLVAGLHLGPAAYQLWPRTAAASIAAAGGTPAASEVVPVSASEQPRFTYDATLGGYTRTEATGPLLDAASGKPWVVPNVVVLQVPVTFAPEVEDVGGSRGLDFGIVGSGAAQFLVGGRTFTGKYTQAAAGPPQLVLDSGAPAPIAPGEVLVCLTRVGSPARVG